MDIAWKTVWSIAHVLVYITIKATITKPHTHTHELRVDSPSRSRGKYGSFSWTVWPFGCSANDSKMLKSFCSTEHWFGMFICATNWLKIKQKDSLLHRHCRRFISPRSLTSEYDSLIRSQMFAACLCISSSITRRTHNARRIILNRCFAAVFSVDRHCFRRLKWTE